MQRIKVQTPAKINLTLEVLNKRPDGFHNIQSIMQAVSLSDFLTISIEDISAGRNEIVLSGTSDEIPYNEDNIVFKAAELYLKTIGVCGKKISVHIEKNIPVCAGLAGGSTNASGTFYGLNEIFGGKLTRKELHAVASKLGSDLNFCLDGGCALCTGRGEFIEHLPSFDFELALIKPKNLGISAKEAYQKFARLQDKSYPDNTSALKTLLLEGKFDKKLIYNSLENAVIDDYQVLRDIKNTIKGALMSGSGPTFFVIGSNISNIDEEALRALHGEFEVFNALRSVNFGVKTV